MDGEMKTKPRWHDMEKIVASNAIIHRLVHRFLPDPSAEWDEFLYQCVAALAEENKTLRETVVRLAERQPLPSLSPDVAARQLAESLPPDVVAMLHKGMNF